MAGFFKKLFSKEDEAPFSIDFSEIPKYLDRKDEDVAGVFRQAREGSEKSVSGAIDDLRQKADGLLSVKFDDDADVHPRLRRVVEKSLPGFASSLKKALPDLLPDDPEEYYSSLIAVVQAVGKCLSSQGKYVHAAFPDEIKDIRASVGIIGREMNAMTEEIKPAVQKREKASAVRGAYEKADMMHSEYAASLEKIETSESAIARDENEIKDVGEMIDGCKKSPDFLEYEAGLKKIASLSEEKQELSDSYHLAVSTVSNVFRKVIYAAEKEGDSAFAKDLFAFDDELLSKGKKDTGALEAAYEGLYPRIKDYLDKNPGFSKNKSEERLLSSSGALTERISEICKKYVSVTEEISSQKEFVESSGEGRKLDSFTGRLEAAESEIAHLKTVISSLSEKKSDIAGEYPAAVENLTAAVSALEGRECVIENIPEIN